jgi:uncharacterized membrane protein YedE/YeeE
MTPRTRTRLEGLAAAGSGALFGVGLAVAGMTRPEKVVGFLNFFRAWDPSLMFVMGGAIAVHALAWRLLRRRPSPLLGARFLVPTRRDLDARLLMGAAIFGVGWGLGGFCPGPGLASLATGAPTALAFAAALLVGNLAAAQSERVIERARRRGAPADAR